MSFTRFCLGGLVVTFLGLGLARGQNPYSPFSGMNTPDLPTPNTGASGPGGGPPAFTGPEQGGASVPPGQTRTLSTWILGERAPGCCGPLGCNGPIDAEVYLRSGFAFQLDGGVFGHSLDHGWTIEGGARTLFFNPAADRAWVVDLGLSNTFNTAANSDLQVTLFNVRVPNASNQGGTQVLAQVTGNVHNLNQTFVNMSGGREWYLRGNALDCRGTNWRVGFDAGGRYGTARMDFQGITHRTDTLGGLFIAAHSDVEIPCGGCVFQAGIRTEYGYTWSDLLQRQNDGDIQQIQLLFTLGARF